LFDRILLGLGLCLITGACGAGAERKLPDERSEWWTSSPLAFDAVLVHWDTWVSVETPVTPSPSRENTWTIQAPARAVGYRSAFRVLFRVDGPPPIIESVRDDAGGAFRHWEEGSDRPGESLDSLGIGIAQAAASQTPGEVIVQTNRGAITLEIQPAAEVQPQLECSPGVVELAALPSGSAYPFTCVNISGVPFDTITALEDEYGDLRAPRPGERNTWWPNRSVPQRVDAAPSGKQTRRIQIRYQEDVSAAPVASVTIEGAPE